MIIDSAGCKIVGTEYTSEHQRLALCLLPPDGAPEFKSAFTDLAAYRLDSTHLGKVIVSIEEVAPATLIVSDWERLAAADQSGTWPGPSLTSPSDATALASRVGLRAFRINLRSGQGAWAISRDYVLLGRRQRA